MTVFVTWDISPWEGKEHHVEDCGDVEAPSPTNGTRQHTTHCQANGKSNWLTTTHAGEGNVAFWARSKCIRYNRRRARQAKGYRQTGESTKSDELTTIA